MTLADYVAKGVPADMTAALDRTITRDVVESHMLTPSHHLQIVGAVVVSALVLVVYDFIGPQRPTQHSLRNQPMLKDIATLIRIGMVGAIGQHITAQLSPYASPRPTRKDSTGQRTESIGLLPRAKHVAATGALPVAQLPTSGVATGAGAVAAKAAPSIPGVRGEWFATMCAGVGILGLHDGPPIHCAMPGAVTSSASASLCPNYTIGRP